MKYKIEEHPNKQRQTFHISEIITEKTIYSISSATNIIDGWGMADRLSADEKETALYLAGALLAIPGVTELTLSKYEIRISKAEVFDWPEIEADVIHVLKSMVAKDGILEEIPRTVCTEADRRRSKAEWERAEREYGDLGSIFNDFPMDEFNDDDDDDRY